MSGWPQQLYNAGKGVKVYNKDEYTGFLIFRHEGEFRGFPYGGKVGIIPFKEMETGEIVWQARMASAGLDPKTGKKRMRIAYDFIRIPEETIPAFIEGLNKLLGKELGKKSVSANAEKGGINETKAGLKVEVAEEAFEEVKKKDELDKEIEKYL